MRFGIRGPVFSISAACATGNTCIGEATRLIKSSRAKAMIVGSSEAAVTELCISSFANMNALSRRNESPETACRPFDQTRDGFVMSEGAAILVLEDFESAVSRGAHIYAEIIGYGHTSDSHHVTAPLQTGESAAKAIELALADAELAPQQVDYINLHGTGTHLNDASETKAIKQVFGDRAYRIAMSSTKSVTGHLMAAAGSVEAVLTIMAIQHGFVPPTINLNVPDPECDLDYTPQRGKEQRIDFALSNSFGFGGHNSIIVIKKI